MPKLPAHQSDSVLQRENLTLAHMMAIYCRGQRHQGSGICGGCSSLLRYARERIEGCPYHGSEKPACGLCRTNCFTTEMRRHFLLVMRFAGPRMMLRHPVLSAVHLWDAVRGRRGKPGSALNKSGGKD